jgi:serine/threonine-protein kinase
MSADRNLLFGVLALQADFIDAQQFAAACSEWAGRKDTPLADLLVERGWLTDEDRAHVEYLLQRRLRKHEGDARASLAAVTSPEVRSLLESVADADVRQSLAGLTPPDRPALPPTVAYEPGSRQRYTLTRLHARGGIGQVWLAHDEDIGRDVALKELRPDRRDNPAAAARFLDEAKITGQLEHPGIVPVYELVQPCEGQACYSMRFVGGRTLADAIRDYHRKRHAGEAGPLDLRELLTAFVGVCNAIAYAHSRGVLHRDLKPANVALGDFGEVLVLDWGLAKVVGKHEEPASLLPVAVGQADGRGETRQGQVLGTPAYMPPEQARGRVDLVDRRSDVYSLGAVLYEVLTGQPPFGGADAQEALKNVIQEPVVPPRQRVATTPPALQAVCLKAMAKEPGDRYPAARELARDVERWLADEPVAAYREPLRARAGRWARRHRQLTTGLVVLLLTGLVGLGVGLWAVRAEQVRTAHERDLAEANLRLAKKAVDDCFQLAKEHPLLQQENMRQVRKLLLEKALPFYEQFRAQRPEDPRIRVEMAGNHYRVGYITAELGRNADAEQSYGEALLLYEQLAKEHPEVPGYQAGLARAYNNLGNLQRESGRRAEAERSYGEARRLRERLSKEQPGVPAYQADLAGTYNNLGNLQAESGRRAEAERSYGEARRLYEQPAKEHPEVTRYQAEMAGTYINLGNLQAESGRRAEAERSYGEARRRYEQLAKEHPDVPAYQADLATTHHKLGLLQAESGRRAEAERSYGEARRLFEQLAKGQPEVTKYHVYLARAHNNLGNLQQESGRRAEAERSLGEACRLQERLAQEQPGVAEYQADLARAYNNLGNLQRESGRRVEAERSYGEARRLFEQLAKGQPDVPAYQAYLARAYNNLGNLQTESGRRAEAERSYGEARRLQVRLAKEQPGVPEYQADLARTYNNLGNLQRKSGRRAEAERSYGEARRLQEQPAREHPDVLAYQAELATTYHNLGLLQAESGRRAEAERSYGEARRLRERLAKEHPEVPEYQDHLADTYNNLGVLQGESGRRADAERSWEEARRLYEQLAREHPDVPAYQASLGNTYNNLGLLQYQSGRGRAALDSYAKGMKALQAALATDPKHATARLYLRNAHFGRAQALTRLARHAEAVQDLDRALELDAGPARPFLRLQRAFSLAHAGDHTQAVSEADALAQAKDVNADMLYDLACVCSLASAAVKNDAKLADRYAARAVDLLRQAVAKGFKDVEHLKKDSDLDPLRGRDDFKKLVAELESGAPEKKP